ncbi:MAG: D-glycero-beta-D-manno-heptose-7-phosphate kinase [Desulfobacterales bacterium]|jgi:D-beta-D-heptose 7-phosphate kinase/D-beta-D-heptose 1-phosphate adenosyltransferase
MHTIIPRFTEGRLLVIGDLMIDEYVWGEVDRISPEAPVQVVSVMREDLTLGGAGNVVNNLRALGAQVAVAGVVGTAEDGQRLLDMFNRLEVDCRGVVPEAGRPTTRKTRIIASNQHVLRIDRETKRDISTASFGRLIAFVESLMPEIDIVLVSDYNKGLVTAALMEKVTAAARRHGKYVIVDPKGLDFSHYQGATLMTPNRKEASLAAGVDITSDASLEKAAHRIMTTVGLEKLLITLGQDGMALFESGAPTYRIATRARQVFDVSGAGDTVISVLGLALGLGASFQEATVMANAAAGIVVGKVGTAPIGIDELTSALTSTGQCFPVKHHRLDELPALIGDLKRHGLKIVLTNGCFDLLHAGHVQLFAAAKELGDFLVVAIDDDASVRALKGRGRPVIRAEERIRILSALDSVDAVVVFASNEFEALLDAIQPDVLVKGSNYASDQVRGGDKVSQLGGRVVLVPVSDTISSSQIIKNIKDGHL